MLDVDLSDEAGADLAQLLDWLELRSLPASRRAAKAIFAALDQLSSFPGSAPAVEGGLRERFVDFGRDGYIIRFRVEPERIVVLRVFHGRQDRR